MPGSGTLVGGPAGLDVGGSHEGLPVKYCVPRKRSANRHDERRPNVGLHFDNLNARRELDDPMSIPAWLDRSEYPFTSKWADVRDGRIHYIDEGAGSPALFVHGTPTWSFEFRHVIRAAMDSSRCIAPDHLGFGLSERPGDASYTPEAHAARLREFVDVLGLDRSSLVVQDYGGPIGLPLP